MEFDIDLYFAVPTYLISAFMICPAGLERVHGFSFGDSLDEHKRSKWLNFQASLKKVLDVLSAEHI